MAVPVPILLAGGMILLFGGKKKMSKKKSSPQRAPCDVNAPPPRGMICKSGFLYPKIIDESMLESDNDISSEEAGSFDIKEEDVSLRDDERVIQEDMQEETVHDPTLQCEEFLQAIYAAPMSDDEIPINKIAVEQTVLPIMKSALSSMRGEFGADLSADAAAPVMIRAALSELVPVCDWEYDDDDYEFKFNGMRVESSIGKDVIYGLLQISDRLIEESQEDLPQADFLTNEAS